MSREDCPQQVAIADLFSARDAFLRDGAFGPCVSQPVKESWLRSSAYGVDPRNVRKQRLDPTLLTRAQASARVLLEAADPVLARVHDILADEPHMIVLSDLDGLILRMLAPRSLVDSGDGYEHNLFEGASWHERDVGTNGIGTAIATNDPVIVVGPQHFVDDYVPWGCVGVPLRTPDGTVAGALDLSIRSDRINAQTWGWALSIAEAIEAALARVTPFRIIDADEIDALEGDVDEQLRRTVRRLLAAQTRLEEWDRRKDEALASLSHELRNPLSAVTMLLDLAERGATDPTRFAEITARLRRQARRLTKLIGDVSDVARVKRGALVVEQKSVDLNQVVRSAAEATSSDIERLQQRLTIGLSSSALIVQGDPDRLEQVFTNLLTNAAKYSPPGGSIVIEAEAEAEAGHAIVRVRDTGHGIAAKDLERIFEEFTRVIPAPGDPGGMGIGLALVRNLVRLHQGSVRARSDGPGKGSEFEVRLPLRARAV